MTIGDRDTIEAKIVSGLKTATNAADIRDLAAAWKDFQVGVNIVRESINR